MNQLDVLAQHRDELLLAEAIGWLHDWQKCIDMKIASDWSKGKTVDPKKIKQWQERGKFLKPGNFSQCIESIEIRINEHSGNLKTIIETGRVPSKAEKSDKLLEWVLGRSHDSAHIEKELNDNENQAFSTDWLSSPFGWEYSQPDNLLENLLNQTKKGLTSNTRHDLLNALGNVFRKAWGDNRRPINEVMLWDWSSIVAALYKAELARYVLTNQQRSYTGIAWRLLSIRVNGLDYLLGVDGIPDLLARQALLKDSWDRVQTLLEETYPMALEVYRDENGPVFVVPDIKDLLDSSERGGKKLKELIEETFALGCVHEDLNLAIAREVVPYCYLDSTPWQGKAPQDIPPITQHVQRQPVTTTDPVWLQNLWKPHTADICTVCGLRPQGPSGKAAERNVCDICEARRADRSQRWATSETDRTIWIDEVADTNGRFAMIVGSFDLTHWLSGDLVRTLLVKEPNTTNGYYADKVAKNPSFARLRRIWETTRRFWHEVQDATLQALSDDRRRLKIYLDQQPNLGPFHVYDLVVGSTDLSVVWIPPQNGAAGYLLTADNLGYIARQLGAESGIYTSPAKAAGFVKKYLCEQFVKNARQPILRNPDASPSRGYANLLAGMRITKVEYQPNAYATAIPILAEPRSFLMLVPADKSLEVLKQIKAKYECEMGKVRDRLPLHLGCVFAARRTPIRAVLEAGRAMLDREPLLQRWQIKKVDRQPGHVVLQLEHSGCSVQWQIPLKMGDGTTDDLWYPYFFLETNGDDSKADASNRRAVKVLMPQSNGKKVDEWIVHAGDLRIGETIYRWSSTFDFEFLDTTARRFEISYDEHGRRPRRTRPFYLEDLDRLEELWRSMTRLTKTQRHQVIRTIEATREAWYGTDDNGQSTTDEVFKQFVADTLAGAAWPKGQGWNTIPAKWRDELIQAGVRGDLADLAELHLEILKE
ncbi:CRISPR-associated protein Csx11 [Roseiflexus sp.]|uniref:CRISPR-associated protein Csx11 n=1 Tax=Roseiflexus sp. TaxID=2562120 RepID=UPI0021DD409E|nr:CRISPR-associated protein Csx11 [Roseiflexus sp.]GIV98637.1 MAG: hypothetical protein KatS3mg058_0041 [Roseiflexus sp.]